MRRIGNNGRGNGEATCLAKSFDQLRTDYAAAKTSRFRRRRTGLSSLGSGADFHYRSAADFLRLLEYARDMDRNDAIVGQTVDRAVTNVIQDGIKVDPQTGNDKLDALLAERWQEWGEDAEQCDLAGEWPFADLERFALRQMLIDGDTLALPNASGKLEMVEAHRLRNPKKTRKNIVHGVQLDDNRRRIGYWLTKKDLDPNKPAPLMRDMKSYPARDRDGQRLVLHIYNPKRVSQTRGVSALAPIFDLLGMFEDINFAKLVQQQIVSCFTIFRERSIGSNPIGSAPLGEQTTETRADGSTRLVEGIAPGLELTGAEGEKLTGFSPNVPNPEFFDHVKLILTLVGINLGLPLVLVLLDAKETNFSGWRGAVDQARIGFRNNQRSLIRKHHRPIYLWKVRQWLSDDAGVNDVAIKSAARGRGVKNPFRQGWNAPRWRYIEPYKDAQADTLRLKSNLTSPRRLAAEGGGDWVEIQAEIVADRALIIETALKKAAELNQNPEARVDWRELANFDLKGLALSKGPAPSGGRPTSSEGEPAKGEA